MKVFRVFKTSFAVLKRDKVAMGLSLMPIAIGLTGLYFFSEWFFTGLPDHVLDYFGYGQEASRFLQGVVLALLAVGYYFLLNVFFVLMVSVVASPFNDFLSARVGKTLGERGAVGTRPNFFRRFLSVWFNELKKNYVHRRVGSGLFFIGLFSSFDSPFHRPLFLLVGGQFFGL